MKKKGKEISSDKDNTIDTSPVKTDVYKYPRGNRYNIVYAKTPNNNQHVRRSDEELQKIIDKKRNQVSGEIVLSLYKGNITILSRKTKNKAYSMKKVSFEENNGVYSNIWLIGPAKLVFKGSV